MWSVLFRMTLTVSMGTLTHWAAAWRSQSQLLRKPAAPTAVCIQATLYAHTHIWLIVHSVTQDDSAGDNDVDAAMVCTCICVCVVARWEHDEFVQLRRFWSGGRDGPNPVLIVLRKPEGGATRQGVPLRGHSLSTQETLWPVSDNACGASWKNTACKSKVS